MATWAEFANEAPELAAAVQARFEAAKHHVLATVRRNGSPRVSGTEVEVGEENWFIGSMLNAIKARDLRRDPRFALHANPGDGSMEGGDAKIAGRAEEVPPAPDNPDSHHFRLSLEEVVLISVAGNRLVIEAWHPGTGVVRKERE